MNKLKHFVTNKRPDSAAKGAMKSVEIRMGRKKSITIKPLKFLEKKENNK